MNETSSTSLHTCLQLYLRRHFLAPEIDSYGVCPLSVVGSGQNKSPAPQSRPGRAWLPAVWLQRRWRRGGRGGRRRGGRAAGRSGGGTRSAGAALASHPALATLRDARYRRCGRSRMEWHGVRGPYTGRASPESLAHPLLVAGPHLQYTAETIVAVDESASRLCHQRHRHFWITNVW